MRKWLTCLLLALFLAVCPAASAEPKIPPAPSANIYVQDYAGVLSSDTKSSIQALGTRLAGATKAQVVVVTVKSLENAGIEEYSLALLRNWGIGDKTLNNGVLMLLAVNDRQSRIEVGYGLEGRLPDAKTGRIQDEYMIPYFQRGDYNGGVWQGYRVLAREVAAEYNVSLTTSDTRPSPNAAPPADAGWDSLPFWAKARIGAGIAGLLLLDWIFFGGNITMMILSLLLRRGGRGGSGGGGFGGGSGGGGGSSRRW